MNQPWLKSIFSSFLSVLFLFLLFNFYSSTAKTETQEDSLSTAAKKSDKKSKKNKNFKESGNQLTDEKGRNLIHYSFPLPDSLKPNYEFWKLIYSKYDKNQVVFHDTENMQIVYSVVDLTNLANQYPSENGLFQTGKKEKIQAEKERIRSILKKLAEGNNDPKNLSEEEKKIYHLFDSIKTPNKFSDALQPDRLRTQTGQKDKFLKAIEQSGAYLPEIEDILTSYGLPMEISRLPFVESMFNNDARSKVGASGIWQFMPQTGKLYVTVNPMIDERNDPIQATHAAARLLKANYDQLQSWPLAINAYNSGVQPLARAKVELGTDDIGIIATQYRRGGYQFASRNFYTEFLAALEVANHYKNYFGEIKRYPPFKYDTYTVQNPLPLYTLAETSGVSVNALQEINPSLSSAFFTPNKTFPGGRTIKIPPGTKAQFEKGAEIIASKRIGSTSYKVAQNDYTNPKRAAKIHNSKRKVASEKSANRRKKRIIRANANDTE